MKDSGQHVLPIQSHNLFGRKGALLPILAALSWYALLLLSNLTIGEPAFFPWPHLFMEWLRWEGMASLVLAQLLGAAAIIALGLLVGRWRQFRVDSYSGAALVGLLLAVSAVVILLAVAWTTATLIG